MPKAKPHFRGIAWGRPEQVELLGGVASAMGVEWVGAGCAESERGSAVAAGLGVDPVDDLRVALGSGDGLDLVLLADPGPFGSAGDDRAALLAAHARGVKVASLEPIPVSAIDLSDPGWSEPREGVRPVDTIGFVPLTRRSGPFAVAGEDLRESFGPVRSASIELHGHPEHGSLAARLFDAIDLAIWLVGEPGLVDASAIGPRSASGLHALPGETLGDLHGDIGVLLRYADGRIATIMASDNAGAWSRSAVLLGERGRMRINDRGFAWTGPDGQTLDTHEADAGAASPVGAITQDIVSLLDANTPSSAPVDHESVLSIAQTALLSARTGQAESPSTIQHLVTRV